VHIIECRELAGKDGDGLSDPVCVVECFGEKQSTIVLPKALNCVFDELFIFNFRDLDKDVFEEGVISIKVNNANFIMKTDLIGKLTCGHGDMDMGIWIWGYMDMGSVVYSCIVL
jgi:hypothetical protein